MTPERISFWKNKKQWTIQQLYFLLKAQEPQNVSLMEPALRLETEEGLEKLYRCVEFFSDVDIENENRRAMKYPSDVLLEWAERIRGVDVPPIWHSLFKPEAHWHDQEVFGARGIRNLYVTIGALATLLADCSGPETGTMDHPNMSALARRCNTVSNDVMGMSESTVRNRITRGVQLFKQSK